MGLLAIKEAAAPIEPRGEPQADRVAMIVRTPDEKPDPSRIGLVRTDHGGFEHYCNICGAWGSFGIRPHWKSDDAQWFCAQHRPATP
jgi:hypothetical protein